MQLKRNKEMEFERLKKSHKKQIIIGALAICVIGGALTFATTRAKYKLTQDLELAKGTINYKPYDFKVMAMYQSENGTNYTEINDMPSSGYIINEEKTYCTTDNKNQVKGKIKTENAKYIFENLSKSDKCYLYFDKIKITNSKDIIANSKINIGSPDFRKIATTDVGIYQATDGMYGGTSYYWRGASTTNYLKFAGFCWRIIRINGDGSLRLIYDGKVCHANGTITTDSVAVPTIPYHTDYSSPSYVGWTYVEGKQRPEEGDTTLDSNAKVQTEKWYNENIGNNATYVNYVADGKYCNDRNIPSNSTWSISRTGFSFNPGIRLEIDYIPTLFCTSDDIYTLKVGLISADEVMYAGGKHENNRAYYLYNGQNIWTMTPIRWNDINDIRMFYVNSNGSLANPGTQSNRDIRPVINLKSDTTISNGNGTIDNPYIVQ